RLGQLVKEARPAHPEKITLKEIQTAQLPVPLASKGLTERDAAGKIKEAKDEDKLAPIMVPLGLTMLMFMVIFVGATPLMQGVVEEKMQKIAEVLLGSVQPFSLMLGKLVGMVGVSLTIVMVYLSGLLWAAHYFHFSQYLPVSIILW